MNQANNPNSLPPLPNSSPQPAAFPGFDLPGGYSGPAPDQDAKSMAMLCHLLGIFTGFVGPLIIWLVRKDSSPFVDDQGKEALNWHISLVIYLMVGGVTAFIFVGFLVILAAIVCNIVFSILGAMAANNGTAYRYPFCFRFIK